MISEKLRENAEAMNVLASAVSVYEKLPTDTPDEKRAYYLSQIDILMEVFADNQMDASLAFLEWRQEQG